MAMQESDEPLVVNSSWTRQLNSVYNPATKHKRANMAWHPVQCMPYLKLYDFKTGCCSLKSKLDIS